jgi:hypothetical protein
MVFVAAFIGAAILVLGAFIARSNAHPFLSTLLGLGDASIMAGLGYGLRRKSRVCGVLLVVFIVAGSLGRMIQAGTSSVSFVNLAILAFVIPGTIGTFRWRRVVIPSVGSVVMTFSGRP